MTNIRPPCHALRWATVGISLSPERQRPREPEMRFRSPLNGANHEIS
jgi:hypothetical protein